MIQLDNGPAGGDYVRYIERLLAERVPQPSMDNDAFLTPVSRQAARPVASAARGLTDPRRPANPTVQKVAKPAAMGAAVAALARGDRAWLEVFGIAVGAVLALLGVFADAFGWVFVVLGVGLIGAMFRRIARRRGAAGVGQTTAISGPPRG
jgi:hypothetical protein